MKQLSIRRLNPETDKALFVEAWLWDHVDVPRWYREMDRVFRPEAFEDFLKLAHGEDQADIGVFENDKLVGLITLSMRAKGMFEAHLSAKRGASVEVLADAGIQVKEQLFRDMGMIEGCLWVARKNYHVRKLCSIIGFRDSGLRIFKGSHRGRVIDWLRLSVTRSEWEAEQVLAA